MKQHLDPYTNLSRRGIRRAQVNALKSLIPDLEPDPELRVFVVHKLGLEVTSMSGTAKKDTKDY
jgi:hypothetical protein